MSETTSRKPTHDILHAKEGSGRKTYYTRLGAAWMHKDQGGMNLQFDFFPVRLGKDDGHIIVRVRQEKKEGEAE